MERHPLDPLSLLFGAAFTALGVALLLPAVRLADLWQPALWPLLLVLLGAWLLLTTVRGQRRREEGDDEA